MQTSLGKADSAVQSVNGKIGSTVSINAADISAVASAEKGAVNGVATLGTDGKVPNSQLSIKSTVIDVRNYGLVGDGIADDTTALNNAYAACVAAGGGVLFVPPNTTIRTTGSGINMNSNTRVVLSAYGVTFQPDQSSTAITIDPDTVGGTSLGAVVEGAYINMTGSQTQTGIKLRNANRQALRDMRISGGAKGIHIVNDGTGIGYCEDNHFENLYINSAAIGIAFENINSGSQSLEENTFVHVSVAGCTTGIWQGPGLEFRDVFMLSVKTWATNPGNQTCWLVEGDITDWVADIHLEVLSGTGHTGLHFTATATNTDKAAVRLGSIGTFSGGLTLIDSGTIGFMYRNGPRNVWGGKVGGYPWTVRRDTDTQDRWRISSAGLEAGVGGATAPDVALARGGADWWTTPDQFRASDGIVTKTKAGTIADADFTAAPTDGALAINTTKPGLVFRAGGVWHPTIPAPISLPLIAQGTAVTWTAMPAAETEFNGSTRQRIWADLTHANEVRLVARVPTTGAAGSQLKVQYSTDNGSTWAADLLSIPIDVVGTAANAKSAWTALPLGAKADVLLRLVGTGGDGVANPSFGVVSLQVR